MNRGIKIACVLICLPLIIGIVGFGVACGPKGPETYKIGQNWELTGWGGFYGSQCEEAVRVVMKKVNEAGGINGKLIELVTYEKS